MLNFMIYVPGIYLVHGKNEGTYGGEKGRQDTCGYSYGLPRSERLSAEGKPSHELSWEVT